jgi:excinuclease UvrABC nuclease subunit
MDEKFARRFYMELLGSAGEGERRFSPERLAATLEQAVGLLQNPSALLEHMREQMIEHAVQLRFERAHQIKKHLDAIVRMREKQNVNRPGIKAETVVWIGDAYALIAQLEDGTVRRRFLYVPLPDKQEPAHAIIALFAALWAERKPHEIITNAGGIGQQVLEETAASYPHIRLCVPQKGRKRALLDICRLNLEYRIKRRMEES